MSGLLQSLTSAVTTPDGIATGRFDGERRVFVSLATGYYSYSTPDRLAAKLAALGQLLWRAREDAWWRALSERLGHEFRGEGLPASSREGAFRQARDTVVCTGSFGGITAESVGMRSWSVVVPRDVVVRLDEEGFVRAASEALSGVFADYLDQLPWLRAAARTGHDRETLARARWLLEQAGVQAP